MIENIARHWSMGDGRSRIDAAVDAVAEVGNPTVVATLTVVSALLPMLFVSGLMGPYMAPIPVNASAAMVFSFFVAVVIAPWLMVRFARKTLAAGQGHHDEGKLGRLYRRLAGRVIATRRSALRFLIGVGVATLVACAMFATKTVTVKMLPFDNKSELQVVLDMPEGTSLEETQRMLADAVSVTKTLPEVTAVDAYAGTASPFNFNGLVRHYYLRNRPEMGDLAVALAPKGERRRNSHAIALDHVAHLAAADRLPHSLRQAYRYPDRFPYLREAVDDALGVIREQVERERAKPFVVLLAAVAGAWHLRGRFAKRPEAEAFAINVRKNNVTAVVLVHDERAGQPVARVLATGGRAFVHDERQGTLRWPQDASRHGV
jgi:multidrug efflux pump subunit AcrB